MKRYGFYCHTSGFLLGASLITEECEDGEYVLHSDYTTLLTRHNALVEAVGLLRKLEKTCPRPGQGADHHYATGAARAEVDRLIAGCKGEG